MSHRIKSSVALVAIAATLLLVSTTALAQDQPAPKWEIFGGYSWADANTKLNHVPLRSYPAGIGASGTYDFSKWVGITLDYGGHFNSGTSGTRVDALSLVTATRSIYRQLATGNRQPQSPLRSGPLHSMLAAR